MLTPTDIGRYKINVMFKCPRCLGTYPWVMYLDGIGFYHMKMAPSTESETLLEMLLWQKIEKHVLP